MTDKPIDEAEARRILEIWPATDRHGSSRRHQGAARHG